MPSGHSSGRRGTNRVKEFSPIIVCVVAGGAAAFSPPSPTGRPIVDAAFNGLAVAAVAYAGASAPWWALVSAGGIAMSVGVAPIVIAVAAIAFALGLFVGVREPNLPAVGAASVGLTANALAWAALEGFFGLTSIVAITTCIAVFVIGIRRRPRVIRRRAWRIAGAVAVLAVLAGVGFGLGGVGARSQVEAAQRHVESGIALLNDGEFEQATAEFQSAHDSLERANSRLTSPLAAGASFLPVLSQHYEVAANLSDSGAALTGEIATTLRDVDVDSIMQEGGTVNLAAVAALEGPFLRIGANLDRLGEVVSSSTSPWLVDAVRDELASLNADILENRPRVENVAVAAGLTPQMLGADGPRVYLVLFTTPAEARGLGGFPGNYAELTIDQGRTAMTDFGRVYDLENAARAANITLDLPREFQENYQYAGFRADGSIGEAPLRNLTMTPHFPWVAEVASDLYTKTTGRPVDGVIVMDVFVIEALLKYAGPIQLTEVPFTLSADNAREFLLRGQYEIAQDATERIDALDEAGQLMFETLLTNPLPSPTTLAHDLGALVAERRLLVWTRDDAEQGLLRRTGLLGELPSVDSPAEWSFTVNNAGANKIDSYLDVAASFATTVGPVNGESIGTIRIELTNNAPADGVPYVVGNEVGQPPGTNVLLLTLYAASPIDAVTLDGAAVGTAAGVERFWNVYTLRVVIPEGESVTVEAAVGDSVLPAHQTFGLTWRQPLALPVHSS